MTARRPPPHPFFAFCALCTAISTPTLFIVLAHSIPARAAAQPDPQTYSLEADVSMRNIHVDLDFRGARLVLFGSVNRAGMQLIDPRTLDIVAVIEGAPSHLTVRRKSREWGIWINTRSTEFAQAPKFYAVASTRPLSQIAPKPLLSELNLGLDDVPITATIGEIADLAHANVGAFRNAAIALGVKDGRYTTKENGINFVGTSLFRGEIDLPANIPVGELDVKVYLFGGNQLLARHNAHLVLEREGLEHFIYTFAHQHSWAYGLATVAMATVIGLISSVLSGRRKR